MSQDDEKPATQDSSTQGKLLDRRKFLKTSAATGTAVTAGLAGCSGGGSGAVKIGVAVPTSGTYSSIGSADIAGVETAVTEQGQLLDRDIEVVTQDTEGDSATARNVFERLATREEVDYIVGPTSSAVGGAVIDVIEENEVLTMYPTAATRSAVGENCSPYIFKTSPTNEQQPIFMAEWLAENRDGDVLTFSADYQAGQDINQFFAQYHEEAGGTVINDMYAPLGESDFSSYFSQIEDADPDILFSFFAGGDAVRFVSQAEDFGLGEDIELTGMGYLTTTDVLPALEGAGEGWKTVLEYAETLERQEFTDFSDLIAEEKDVSTPTLYHARGYTAAKAYFEAVEAAGSTNTDDVIDSLEGYEIAAPHGDITYRAGDHQAILDYYIREVQDGQNQVLDTQEDIIHDDTCTRF